MRKSSLISFIFPTCLGLLAPGIVRAGDEQEFILLYRQARLNQVGAAEEISKQIACEFRDRFYKKTLDVAAGTVEGFGSVISVEEWGLFELPDGSCAINEISEPDANTHKIVNVRKRYQEIDVTYAVAVPTRAIKDVRAGQKVSFSMRILGVSYGGDRSSNWVVVTGAAEAISTETKVLRCKNGHEYAPSSGFKFCPVDGLRLE